MSRYVIITPAHNEEAFIEKTIRSMIAQSTPPLRWIIVNDASNDSTAKIVAQHLQECNFLRLVTIERPPGRDFTNKVTAFRRGFAELADCNYDFLGNLDADVSFTDDYFALLLREFALDSKLGIAGGMVATRVGSQYISQEVALDSVAGAVQLFRRTCFEDIGGYHALPRGGIDAAAEIKARMKGWRVRTFAQHKVLEHRRTGTASASPLKARLNEGRRLYCLGYDFSFYVLRCLYRFTDRPWMIGSIVALWGFVSSWLRREPIALPIDVVLYLRAEQRSKILDRLRRFN